MTLEMMQPVWVIIYMIKFTIILNQFALGFDGW